MTCEEDVRKVDEFCARDHGYCFEVPAAVEPRLAEPVPIRGMGRFNHEAIAVDPKSGVVYETEDRLVAGFYRFIPDPPGSLAEGGRLEMLAVDDRPNYDTADGQQIGDTFGVTRERIRQLRDRALKRLREGEEGEALASFAA